MKGIYFISGIDTNIGKSIATGWLAGQLLNQNVKVITQKLVQTGNKEYSEDIELHRKIMKIEMLPEDISKLTAPVIFSYPSSPHLAAKIDKRAETECDLSPLFYYIVTSGICIRKASGKFLRIY